MAASGPFEDDLKEAIHSGTEELVQDSKWRGKQPQRWSCRVSCQLWKNVDLVMYILFVGKSVHFLTDKGYTKPISWWSEHKQHLRWGITWKNVLNKRFNKKVGSVKCKLDTKLISRTALLVPVSFDKERLILTRQFWCWFGVPSVWNR